jgi:uncharacterized protein
MSITFASACNWPDTARSAPRLDLLVLQPTPFCNLDCSYCYLPHRDDRRRITPTILRRSLERVFESPFLGERLTIVWHAGEPLVLPRSFYDDAFALAETLRPAGLRITHSIQTNATLLDEAWAAFLRDRGVQIGVSLDGPRHLHDAHRRTRRGGGSFDRAMAGIAALRVAGVAFHVICVLTAEGIAEPDALFDFFVDNGIREIGFNIDEQEGANARSSLAAPGADARFRLFLERFLDRLAAAPPGTLVVREIAGALAAIASPRAGDIDNPQVEPLRITSIDVDGNVGTFSPELLGMRDARYGDFSIGNVAGSPLAAMLASPAFRRLDADIRAGVAACRAGCQYFALCGGGAPANKLFENGTFASTETLYCRLGRKAVVDVALGEMERRLGLGPGRPRIDAARPPTGDLALDGAGAGAGLDSYQP